MAEFVIRLTDERGHVTEQKDSARSEDELRERLRQAGLIVVGVKAQGLLVGGRLAVPKTNKLNLARFVQFNQQLVTLLRAGLPALTALDLLARQQREPHFRGLLHNVRERIKSGESLSEAFDHQSAIPKLYTTTLLAGEKSGNLDEVLNRYLHFQRLALSFRKKLKASLIYPALLVTMVVVMMIFLVTFVVPRFADLYSQLGADLPDVTRWMLAFGVDVQQYSLVILGGATASVLGIWRWMRTEKGAALLDRLRLATPLLGVIWLKYQVSMFTRMMATLLAGGLPLVPALRTAGSSIQSQELSLAVNKAAQRVSEGQSLARSLVESGRFPDLAVEMIEVGESSGALSQMLTSVAEFYEEDVETTMSAALSLIEPAILILMAIVVGFVLISLYLPIFKLGASGVR